MPNNYVGIVNVKFDAAQMAQIRAEIKAAKNRLRWQYIAVGVLGFCAGFFVCWLVVVR